MLRLGLAHRLLWLRAAPGASQSLGAVLDTQHHGHGPPVPRVSHTVLWYVYKASPRPAPLFLP